MGGFVCQSETPLFGSDVTPPGILVWAKVDHSLLSQRMERTLLLGLSEVIVLLLLLFFQRRKWKGNGKCEQGRLLGGGEQRYISVLATWLVSAGTATWLLSAVGSP